jgi:hypothetical protein
MPHMRSDEIRLPVAAGDGAGYGSALRRLADGSLVTSWIEGTSAFRLGHVDPASGDTRVLKGLKGLLRDAVDDDSGSLAWLLTTHGLHELSLHPFKLLRSLRKGIGTYSWSAVRLDADTIGVAKRYGRSLTLVSLRQMEVVGRINVPLPELAVFRDGKPLLLSFASGEARALGPDLRPLGKPMPIPVGTSPRLTIKGVAHLPGRRRPELPPEQMVGLDADRYSTVVAEGHVAWLQPDSLAMSASPANLGIRALIGEDDTNRLVAHDSGRGDYGRQVLLVAPDGTAVVERTTLNYAIVEGLMVGPRTAALSHASGSEAPDRISLVSWS